MKLKLPSEILLRDAITALRRGSISIAIICIGQALVYIYQAQQRGKDKQ